MAKTHVYFVPGLAANGKIYERIQLDPSKYVCHFLEWKIPRSKSESIQSYARRMCEEVKQQNPILIGVSFGGIMVQEMSKIISAKKVIIISSIKTNVEYPKKIKFIAATKVYKLLPLHLLQNLDTYIFYVNRKNSKKKMAAYKRYLSIRNSTYLQWAIHNVLHWKQHHIMQNVMHIHGTSDGIFPSKRITNFTKIEGGTHTMILTKAKKITFEIEQILSCQYHSN